MRIDSALIVMVTGFWLSTGATAGESAPATGGKIYRERCASCHGESGEGVKGGYSRKLVGDKSAAQLERFIGKSMPKDAPGTCTGEEAAEVARFIHDTFYSPIAQARNRRARIELSRLTVRQYQNAVADLVGSFRDQKPPGEERGLKAGYFKSDQPGRDKLLERVDPQVRFKYGEAILPPDKVGPEGFTARWTGSVIAPDTGAYEFVIRSDQAARLWLNDQKKEMIDVWVKSGNDTEYRASRFLIGGRRYPIQLDFSSHRQGVQDKKFAKDKQKPSEAFIELCWKTPKGVVEVIPSRFLSPERAAEVLAIDTPFPPDDRSFGYERGTSVSKSWDEATTGAAIEAADYLADHLGELGGFRKTDADREAKALPFCRKLVERAFRRPLTDEQVKRYIENQLSGAKDLETGIRRVVLLALQSPWFLYLDLTGEAPDAYAVASRLSFALWDSLPDQKLLEAAAAHQLASPAQVANQAERMVDDPRTRSKVRQFLLQWLQIEQIPYLAKDPKRFPEFVEPLTSDLRTSLELFLDEVIWGSNPDFRRLLNSNELFVNGRIAKYYGVDLPADAPFQKVVTEKPPRSGVLSHPYLLARFAYPENTSPIHRGVFLLRSILGRTLLPPPEAFAPLAPDLHPDLTTRERVSLQTKPDACQSCHGMINPLGFSLERFDAVGRYREAEKDRPINAAGWYEPLAGEKKTFEGDRQLAEFLAGSEEVHRAFVAQLFHHLVKQPILAYGPQTPARLRQAFAESGFNVRKLLVEIAATASLAGLPPADAKAADPAPKSALDRAAANSYNAGRRKPERSRSF